MSQTLQTSDILASQHSESEPEPRAQELSASGSEGVSDSEVSPEKRTRNEQESVMEEEPATANQKQGKGAADFNSAVSHPSDESAREDRSKNTLQSTPSLESGLKQAGRPARAGVPSVFNGAADQKGYTKPLLPQENPQVAPVALKTAPSELSIGPEDLNASHRRSSRVRRKKGAPFEDAPEEEKKSQPLPLDKQDSKSLAQPVSVEMAGEGDLKNINNKVKGYKRIRTFEECLQLFRNMHSFDWDQKDIANLKSSPWNTLTPEAFWFYCTALYFPFSAYNSSQMGKDEALAETMKALRTSVPLGEQLDKESPEVGKLFKSILQQDGRLKAIFKLYMQQSMEDGLKKKENTESDKEEEEKQTEEQEVPAVALTDEAKMQNMIKFIEKELKTLERDNDTQLESNQEKLRHAFENPVEEATCFRAEDMESYPVEFLGHINKLYAKDMKENYEWYLENTNEIILNSAYPSKLEKEFLKHIELQQQKKNDLTYKKLILEIEKNRKGNKITSDVFEQEQLRLSTQRQQQIAHEDAQCAICNSGDYEDEDLIVFCGLCNVPVHQSCYGIDQIPENDWICYSCEVFTQSRGFCVSCFMCSKKGGAMKPTNLLNPAFSEPPKQEDLTSTQKKKGKKSSKQIYRENSSLFPELEDKTCSLHNVLVKEQQFQSDLRVKDYDNYEINLPLKFEGPEKESQIPEDYAIFFHRNEKLIQEGPEPATKYHWVHLSCASWIPGTQVTPKTPIKFTPKMEKKRFDLRCIICLKKQGACIQCQHSKCQIAFHIECARRSGYFMEIERKGNLVTDKLFKIYCEKHRPLKIVKEMQERDQKILEEIFSFCRTIEKCTEIEQRNALRSQLKEPKKDRKHEIVHQSSNTKKWREKDKKYLLEQVKYYFLQIRKLRLSVIRIKPKGIKKRNEKEKGKKYSKNQLKFKIQKGQQAGTRRGLRSAQADEGQEVTTDVFKVETPKEQKQEPNQEEIAIIQKLSQEAAPEENQEVQETLRKTQTEPEVDEEEKLESSPLQIEQVMEEELKQQAEEEKSKQEKKEEELNQMTTYKMMNQPFPQLDWALTLSQNDFPWYAVKFGNFSAKDCYEKYTSIVKDQETFFKKVLQQKTKYAKVLLQPTQPIIYTSYQIDEPEAQEDVYCYCKNQGPLKESIFVYCDGGEDVCPNKGWIHHNCDEELKVKSQAELDSIKEFFCQDCRLRKEDPEAYAKKFEAKKEIEQEEEEKMEVEESDADEVSEVEQMESDRESEKEDEGEKEEEEKEDEEKEDDSEGEEQE